MESMTCPKCGGPGFILGTLSIKQWWRCRDCHYVFPETEAMTAPCIHCGEPLRFHHLKGWLHPDGYLIRQKLVPTARHPDGEWRDDHIGTPNCSVGSDHIPMADIKQAESYPGIQPPEAWPEPGSEH